MKPLLLPRTIGSLAFSLFVTLGLRLPMASAERLGDVQSWKQDGNAVTFVCGKPVVRLEFWADDVVRVTLSPAGKFNPSSKHDVALALEGCYGAPPSISVTDGDSVRMATERMTVRVDKKPFRLHFLQRKFGGHNRKFGASSGDTILNSAGSSGVQVRGVRGTGVRGTEFGSSGEFGGNKFGGHNT